MSLFRYRCGNCEHVCFESSITHIEVMHSNGRISRRVEINSGAFCGYPGDGPQLSEEQLHEVLESRPNTNLSPRPDQEVDPKKDYCRYIKLRPKHQSTPRV